MKQSKGKKSFELEQNPDGTYNVIEIKTYTKTIVMGKDEQTAAKIVNLLSQQ